MNFNEFDDDYHETDRNLARDILATIGRAFGFFASSQLSRNRPGCGESWRYYYFQEVAAARWFKRANVELLVPSRELLTSSLDVNLPRARHRDATVSRIEIYDECPKRERQTNT